MRSKIIILLKILFSCLLIAFLVFDESIKLSLLFKNFFLHLDKLFISILLIFLSIIIGSYRWYLILKVFKVNINLYTVFKITYIGNLFNSLLLGGYGGDAFRAYYIYKITNKKKITSLVTVLIDRIIGVIGLFLVIFFFVFQVDGSLKLLLQTVELIRVKYIIIFIFILIVFFFFLYLYLIQKFQDFKEIIKKFIEYLVNNIFVFFISINLSIFIFLTVNFVAFLLSKYLFGFDINLEVIFISNSIASFANIIPITPGGLGVGEYSFSTVIKVLIKNQELVGIVNIFIMFRLLNVITSLPSLYFFFSYKK
jgi:uncharacterized membrane protein YbhN (UPF0104 family)